MNNCYSSTITHTDSYNALTFDLLLLIVSSHSQYENFILCFRMFLAALHYNENSERTQATTKDGDKRYAVSYSKATANFAVKEDKS